MRQYWGVTVCLLLLIGLAGAGAVAIGDDSTPIDNTLPDDDRSDVAYDIFDRLDRFGCPEVSYLLYQWIPDYFYQDEPDSLIDVINYWDNVCGPAEPITRIRILGSIWDGSFREDLYDESIIDQVIWRYDPIRVDGFEGEFHPGLASGGVATESDFVANRGSFDQFTIDLAYQLLPHVQAGTLEEFFCLFYSGRPEPAFRLLENDDFYHTKLGVLYRREVRMLTQDRWIPHFGLTGGQWQSSGHLARVGDHVSTGGFAGASFNRLQLQCTIDVRLGRSDSPYYVGKDGIDKWSDRFNALAVMAEIGYTVLRIKGHELTFYGGLGLHSVQPFKDDELYLNGFATTCGVGYRAYLDSQKNWFLCADARREWIRNANQGGSTMDGGGCSLRVGVGLSLDKERDRRLEALAK